MLFFFVHFLRNLIFVGKGKYYVMLSFFVPFLRCVQNYFRVHLGELIYNLFELISTFNENYRCLEELIKITHDPL